MQVYEKHLAEIRALGASFIAISPQTPDHSFSTTQKNELTFEVLSDVGNHVARHYRLVFPPTEELKSLYSRIGLDLASYNGDASSELPIPGTFVVGQDGKICLAYLDPDITHRLEPYVVIESLGTVARNQKEQFGS